MNKHKLFLLLLALLFGVAEKVSAQTISWDGGGTTNAFSEAANWTGDVVPTSTNSILFNGGSTKNCDFDVAVTVLSMSINSGYTGVINGSNVAVSLTGSYVQADGTFNSTSDSLSITNGHFNKTGGTFNHNSGTVRFFVSGVLTTNTLNITGSPVFSRLIIWPSTGTQQRNVNFGTATTTETMSVRGGNFSFAYTGNLTVHSLLDLRSTGNFAPSNNTAIFTLGGSGNFTLTSNQTSQSRDRLPNLVFNTAGNIYLSNFISVQGNWNLVTGTVVPMGSTVCFFGSTSSILGTANQFNSIYINGTNLTFPSGSEVKFSGVIWFLSGVATFPTTSLIGLNGTGYQELRNFLGTTINLGSLRVYNTGARTTSLGSNAAARFVIMDSLKLDGGASFGSINHLILNSSTSLKARIAQIGSGSSITGSVTVRTIVPGGLTGWANLGTPGINGQTVKSWDTFSTSAGANGIPMTCNGCSWDENSVSNGPFTSIQGWTETTGAYSNLTGGTSLAVGTGYWVYVGNGPTNTSDMTLVNFGTVAQGNVNRAVTRTGSTPGVSGFNLVSNPYACPIGWSKVFAASTNVNNAIYIYSADLGATAFVGGVSDTPGGANNIIPAGQAFYVEASAAGSVNFTEACKMDNNTGANPLLKSTQSSGTIGDMFRLKLQGSSALDFNYTAFRIHPEASDYFDSNWDAQKVFQSPGYVGYPGPYTQYTTISTKDKWMQDYSIQSIASITGTLGVPVLVKVMASGNYTISAQDFENYPGCMFLRDKLTNAYVNIKNSDYAFSISDTTSAPRFELVLCEYGNTVPTALEELSQNNQVKIYNDGAGVLVETEFESETNMSISAYNLLGQSIMENLQVSGDKTKTYLNLNASNEIVFVKVSAPNKSYVKKLVVH